MSKPFNWRVTSKLALFVACATPFIIILARAFEFMGLNFGANPVAELIDTLGKTGLNILLISLAVSPLRRLSKWNVLVIYRRMLGLFAFFYISMHFFAYAVLDLQLAWTTVFNDIAERPYITVGMTALLLMIPLAITSTRGMQRRLKRNWIRLHKLVYVIGVLALTHYIWQTKLDLLEPFIYAGILIILLGERLIRRITRQRIPDSRQQTQQRV